MFERYIFQIILSRFTEFRPTACPAWVVELHDFCRRISTVVKVFVSVSFTNIQKALLSCFGLCSVYLPYDTNIGKKTPKYVLFISFSRADTRATC